MLSSYVCWETNLSFPFHLFQNFPLPEDLSAYDGLELRLKGDGRRYKLIIRTSPDWDTVGYTGSFDTIEGQWQSVSKLKPDNNEMWFLSVTLDFLSENLMSFMILILYWDCLCSQVRLPFSSLRPIFRARTVSDAAPFNPSKIISLQACFFFYFHIFLSYTEMRILRWMTGKMRQDRTRMKYTG